MAQPSICSFKGADNIEDSIIVCYPLNLTSLGILIHLRASVATMCIVIISH